MGGGFIAAAGQVQPDNAVFIQYPQAIKPFGRQIDAPLSRTGGDKKHFLRGDKFNVLVI